MLTEGYPSTHKNVILALQLDAIGKKTEIATEVTLTLGGSTLLTIDTLEVLESEQPQYWRI